jgi:hypothetical protein
LIEGKYNFPLLKSSQGFQVTISVCSPSPQAVNANNEKSFKARNTFEQAPLNYDIPVL